LKESLEQAEGLAAGFYCIPPREWNKSPFDIVTMDDSSLRPLPEGILAEVRRSISMPPSTGRAPSIPDYYTIRLSDENIKKAVEKAGARFDLESLLTYVLTHEIIHVIRFTRQSSPFFADEEGRNIEEMKVSGLTTKVLESTTDEKLSFLSTNFRNFCGHPHSR
jgi:hypothetical protein